MFEPKEYPCKCLVCGREFVIVTGFLSGVDWYLSDGRVVTMISCNADLTVGSPCHPVEEVRGAWESFAGGTG